MATFRGSFRSHVPEIWRIATFGGLWCSHVSQTLYILNATKVHQPHFIYGKHITEKEKSIAVLNYVPWKIKTIFFILHTLMENILNITL